ncbi:ACT domain-containing protein [Mucilaginibacter sp. L3T2-6]|uniref:ACT domain-containing protein n=1 Tax=Mucilaginibacter sp. L3T2-6 TaxID=3062491 RepID=UPI0026767E9D|nr:ACT domain-containing protein [Mucilaginibacter sp. L3T2-6]MDO3641644.1 ACT domain-containing protein [Mucilaginibacter sp. L3T2-6]MDV6214138.1 ACT domain-containing protein [Mucilaginibacter sp. L3T2-6]
MSGELNLMALLKTMSPRLNEGDYVFCTTISQKDINPEKIIGLFKENEGWTVIIDKQFADELGLSYSYIASWITLTIHSSLEAVGLTAAFSNALANEGISCNVVAAYYHDHIFVAKSDAEKAIKILERLALDNH